MDFKIRAKSLIQPPHILAIGSSTGGLQALTKLFSDLKGAAIDIPIVITQHLPEKFDESFASKIAEASGRKCIVVTGGEVLHPGEIYFAPSKKHLKLVRKDGKIITELDDSPPINFCKPAVDPMFASVAKVFKKNVLALVLTGIGSDGLEGAKEIVKNEGTVIAQDKDSSVVWGMPAAVSKEGLCSAILPLDEIADFVKEFSFGKIR